jgi:hypothetical protein
VSDLPASVAYACYEAEDVISTRKIERSLGKRLFFLSEEEEADLVKANFLNA